MARKPAKSKNSLTLDRVGNADKAKMLLSDVSDTQSPDTDLHAIVSSEAAKRMSVSGETIALITVLHRQRKFAMEQRKRSDLATGAYLRGALGWRKDLPDAERKVIGVKAAAIAKSPAGTPWESIVNAQVQSREPFEAIEDAALKEMVVIAKALPVWNDWGKDVRGFGAASLAVIIAEAGALDNYPTIPKLWKRMGLAVMGDVRQGGLAKGAGADAWIAHGYNPARRSTMWNIGDTMLKAQVRKEKDANGEDTGGRVSLGKYGALYLTRKEYELARDPDIAPIKAHRRAQRVMEKRLLKDLWQAWHRDRFGCVERPDAESPDAERIAA